MHSDPWVQRTCIHIESLVHFLFAHFQDYIFLIFFFKILFNVKPNRQIKKRAMLLSVLWPNYLQNVMLVTRRAITEDASLELEEGNQIIRSIGQNPHYYYYYSFQETMLYLQA